MYTHDFPGTTPTIPLVSSTHAASDKENPMLLLDVVWYDQKKNTNFDRILLVILGKKTRISTVHRPYTAHDPFHYYSHKRYVLLHFAYHDLLGTNGTYYSVYHSVIQSTRRR